MAIHMFQQLIDTLKKSPKRIVFTEGTDARILEASARLLAGTWLAPILIGNEAEVKAAAEEVGFNIRGAEIIDPATYPDMDKMVEEMVALRRGKMTADECRAALMKGNYFGTMLVKMGVADCLLGGATYSTADTVRPALQLIKTKPENKIVSSCFIMVREGVGDNTVLAMGDCAINIDPTEDELVEIGLECAKCAKTFGIDPKVAYLSYSTKGSGKGDTVDKMRNACAKAKAAAPELAIDGEMQFDAAVSPTVGQLKFPGSPVAGYANTFIFPNINAGNIGYKIAQRLGGFDAYGPILLGLNAPINDLSRGCNAQEVYSMAIITAALASQPSKVRSFLQELRTFSGHGGDLRPLRGHGAPRGQAFCARAQNLDAGALLVLRSKKAGGPTGTCLWGVAPWPSSPPRWPNWPSKVRSFLQGLRTFSGYGGRSPVPSGPPRHQKGCRGGFSSRSKWTNLFAALP